MRNSQLSDNTPINNISSLDGLRGLACLLVVFSHAGNQGLFYSIKGTGQLGVMLFFSLSGFLMSYLYGQRQLGVMQLTSYGIKRFFRVYPAYLLVVVLSYVIYSSGGKYAFKIDDIELINHILLTGKVSILWTIPVEMKFYLVFPFMALAISVFKSAGVKAVAAVGILIVMFYLNLKGNKLSVWPYMEFFTGGVAAGYIYAWIARLEVNFKWVFNLVFGISLCGLLVSIPILFKQLFGFSHRFWADGLVFSNLMSLCVLSCALSSGLLNRLFSNSMARFIGNISFSLYLVHLPCMRLVKALLPFDPTIELFAALAASVAAAYILHLAVERPSRNTGKYLANAIEARWLATAAS
jgi:peptidoglycan/LPS O-acetylase OafA/YrhL